MGLKVKVKVKSCPTLCDPWTVAHQASPSMGFSRQEYWSGLPFLDPHKSWWLPLSQPLSLCPQPWVLAHVIPSDGCPVLQEPQGLGSMAGGRWHPTRPPYPTGHSRDLHLCKRAYLSQQGWQPTPVFLPREFYGQRSLMGYSSWSHKESGTTEQLTLSFYVISC